MSIHDEVQDKLDEGWRPSKVEERTWVRGVHREQRDDDVVETGADERMPMSAEEEQALITYVYRGEDG